MPAWSVPGCHSASRPCIRRQRIRVSWIGEGQRVADVQAAGDVRRRDHDGEGGGVGRRVAGEGARALPAFIEAGLDAPGVRVLSSMARIRVPRPRRSPSGRPARRTCQESRAADHALDLGPDQALHQRRQVRVEPFLQQRAQLLPHHVLDASGRRGGPGWTARPRRARSRLPTEAEAAAAAAAPSSARSPSARSWRTARRQPPRPGTRRRPAAGAIAGTGAVGGCDRRLGRASRPASPRSGRAARHRRPVRRRHRR